MGRQSPCSSFSKSAQLCIFSLSDEIYNQSVNSRQVKPLQGDSTAAQDRITDKRLDLPSYLKLPPHNPNKTYGNKFHWTPSNERQWPARYRKQIREPKTALVYCLEHFQASRTSWRNKSRAKKDLLMEKMSWESKQPKIVAAHRTEHQRGQSAAQGNPQVFSRIHINSCMWKKPPR